MDLAEIKGRRRTGNKRDGWLIKDADYQWLIAEVEKLATEREELWQELNAMQDRAEKAEASLTLSRAEGKREGMEEAAKIAEAEPIPSFGSDLKWDGYEMAKEDIAAAIREAAQETPDAACEWKPWHDESGCFDTACGNVQYFSEGNVADNRYKVCPYCGKNISVKA